ncbi:GNAT family N-acetyltransferase [Ferrovibrio sp.]|uniref:GNAT family N-acetyltransferase n=1 Tax=Ferrovibrio sp. TaxID=1917215 RepID=UPI003D122F04
MTPASMNTVTDNTDRSQYELDVDGQTVFARYRRQDGQTLILHVEAPVNLRGSGAADRLMRGIVTLAAEQGTSLVPLCSYARAWMARHPS